MIALNENRRAGMLLCGLGLLFSSLGFLLFDSALLSIGNILFLASFPLLVGMSQAIYLFNPLARPERWRGIVAFWLGVILVRAAWLDSPRLPSIKHITSTHLLPHWISTGIHEMAIIWYHIGAWRCG